MNPGRRRSATALNVVIAGVLASTGARAADLSFGMDLGVGHNDNIARVDEGEQDETIASLGAQLRLNHESRRLLANVASRFEYLDYMDDTYDGEVVGNLIGNATFNIVEDRFKWVLDDTFGQATQNQFAAATPDNRENVNNLSTGPDITLALGSRNQLLLNGRYIDVQYEDSELDNHRVRAALALRRSLSEASSLSANVTTEQVRFDNDEQSVDFDSHEAFLNYKLDAARTSLSMDAGASEFTSEGQDTSGWLGRLELTRRASPSLTVGLDLGHDFSDAGSSFTNLQAQQPGAIEPVPVQQTFMPFQNNYGTVFARFSRNRTSIQLRAGFYDETYDELPQFDRKRITVNLGLDRNLNSAVSVLANAQYSRQDYENLGLEFTDLAATLGMKWRVTRLSNLSFEYRYLSRDDDDGSNYRANEVWIRFGFMVGEGAAGGAGP